MTDTTTPRPNGGRRPFPPEMRKRRYTLYATDAEWQRIVQTVPRFADIRPGADPNTYRKTKQDRRPDTPTAGAETEQS